MASSIPTSARTFDFDSDAAPARKINDTQVDTQLDLLHANINKLKTALDGFLRSDDTMQDSYVRLRHLAIEVSTIIASQGWQPKQAVALATVGNIALTGEQLIDGVLTNLTRVLVKDQTLPQNNGPYISGPGAWVRATDGNTAAALGYAAFMVLGGLTNANDSFVVTAAGSTITLGITPIILAQFGNSSAGGGSSSSSGGGIGYNVKDTAFGAIGEGISHPLSVSEAAAFNTQFALYGAQGAYAIVAGNERDWAAIQCAMWKAAVTGECVYLPPGIYKMGNKTLSLKWTATPITGQPARPKMGMLYGAGHGSSEMVWSNLAAAQISLDLTGESNPYAVQTHLRMFRIYQDATCNAGAVCMRVGDAKELFSAHRVFCEGANGLQLKIASSVSYGQLCTHFVECKFDANHAYQWGDNTGGTFFSVYPDSGGAFWDNVLFDSCEFGGLVYCRATIATFFNCQFYSSAKRAAVYDGCLYAPLGRVTVRDSYFEDYRVAVLLTNGISDLRGATIEGSHFGGTTNDVGAPLAKYAIQVIGFGVNKLGLISICDNTLNYAPYSLGVNGHHQGEVGFEGVDIYAPGTRLFVYNNVNVYDTYAAVKLEVTGCYLFSFDASDDATTGQGKSTMQKAKVLDQMQAGAVYVPRKGVGATNADYWGMSVSNAANNDAYGISWSSTTYTTGGGLPWLGNDMAFEYMPYTKVKRMGFGTLPLYYEWSYALMTVPYGLRVNTGKDINSVSNSPHWIKYTLTAAQVAALGAALTGNVIIVGLPAGVKIHAAVMKITTQFAGTTTLTCSVGIVGTLAKYAPAFNLKQAANVFQDANLPGMESFAAAVNIVAALTATGTNLNTVSAGQVEISLLVSLVEGGG